MIEYQSALAQIHARFAPRVYLEVGVRRGHSLRLSRARRSIGIDPEYDPNARALGAELHRMTSDEYFARNAPPLVDLAFIDGMHLVEYALRDFINVERHCGPGSLIVFDDVLPQHPSWATRERGTKQWTGDVWKIVPVLAHCRPDLQWALIDSAPGGLLAVWNLDPGNTALPEVYDGIVAEMAPERAPGPGVISRTGARPFAEWAATGVMEQLRGRRQ